MSFAEKKIPEPQGKLEKRDFRDDDLEIKHWNPPSSLFFHTGNGSKKTNKPIFNFNLNLGFIRLFVKSDDNDNDTYLFNPLPSYLVELKPFDLISFLNSGSEYSLYTERNDWLKNFTLIVANKTFSNTQFLTTRLNWYFDFLNNAVDIREAIIPQSQTSKAAIDSFYPTNREIAFGVSNRIHLYQTETMAIGVLGYFEFQIPQGTQKVAKGSGAGELDNLYSSRFTYSALAGAYFSFTIDDIKVNTELLYQRLEGDFDAWVLAVKQNSISLYSEALFSDDYMVYLNYLYINWKSEEYGETVFSHTVLLGGEVKGFGESFYWLGLSADYMLQVIDQQRGLDYIANLFATGFDIGLNFYPLAFHTKNYHLKVSFLYGLIYNTWTKELYSNAVVDSSDGFGQSMMFKISYSF